MEPELLAEVVAMNSPHAPGGELRRGETVAGTVSRWTSCEVIGAFRPTQAIAFRLLSKDEAISVYEYLDTATQQSLLSLLRSGEMWEVVEEMSPDDARLFEELPAKVVRQPQRAQPDEQGDR